MSVIRFDAELTVRKGENGRTWARLQRPDETNLAPGDIDEIMLRIFNLSDKSGSVEAIPGSGSLSPISSYVFDTLQTQNWPGLGGFNFTAPVPSRSADVDGGNVYLFKYEFRLKDDTSILWLVGCTVESVLE